MFGFFTTDSAAAGLQVRPRNPKPSGNRPYTLNARPLGLGVRGLGFRGLGFRGLGFRGLGV